MVYRTNKIGRKTDPWGTPQIGDRRLDEAAVYVLLPGGEIRLKPPVSCIVDAEGQVQTP